MWNILPYCKDLMWNVNPQQQWDHGIKKVATMMTQSYLNF